MITYVRTNIFESAAQVLVNTVNTVGVMGKGLAKEFKRLYPEMFASYQAYCESGDLTVGKLQIFRTPNKWILNFPTKTNWRQPSKLEYIESGLQKFVDNYEAQGITSAAFPMLGCGNGGLEWDDVKPIMEKYLKNLPIDIFIHVARPDEFRPEHTKQQEIDAWLKSEPAYLSSIEFVTHLRQRYYGLINTVTTPRTRFDVTQDRIDGEDVFCLEKDKIKLRITASTLANIWVALRNTGILHQDMLSAELASHAEMVMAFLSELEYVTLTQIGDEDAQTAVRLLAYKQPEVSHPRELFAA